jgi:hypothetical protein
MSRLFDRVMAHSCRPATRADFAAFSDNKTGRTATLAEINSVLEASGATVLDEAGYQERRAHQRAVDRAVVSDERLDLEALERVPVFDAESVASYLYGLWVAGGQIDFGAQLGQIAPPFAAFWVEAQTSPRHGLHSWGAFVSVADDSVVDIDLGPGPGTPRWALSIELCAELRKNDPFGPLLRALVMVDDTGQLMMDGQDVPWMPIRPASAAFLDAATEDEDLETWVEELKFYVYATLLTMSFMHCKNVDLVDHEPPEKLSKNHRRRTGRPLVSYKTLDIDPMRKVLSRDGHAETDGLASALHICRGHFKTFTPDAPLFGKLTGSYWWADHVRGDVAQGAVEKQYRLRIDDGRIGRAYEPADETPPASPRQVGADPDRSGRGRVAHAATQNALAAAVHAAGFVPRSPRPEEPQFDLAWATPDALWVCEVKSITPSNELAQMHKAIGQVIDYAHRIDADRAVRMMIALEQQPVSGHWVAECAAQSIVLVWPDGFTAALEQ